MAASTVAAVGAALAYSAIPLTIMRAVPESETAAANSLNTLARQLGTSSCTAVVAAVTATYVLGDGGPPSATAYTISFVAAGAAGLLATVLVLLTPAPKAETVAAPAPATAHG